jgi:hypothetical protein
MLKMPSMRLVNASAHLITDDCMIPGIFKPVSLDRGRKKTIHILYAEGPGLANVF